MRCSSLLPLLLFLLMAGNMAAQQPLSWQEAWQEMADDEEEWDEETMEMLQELAQHPVDLNGATREELERLPFLSDRQVMSLMDYRDRFGPMRSVAELRMIDSLDYRQQTMLPFFVSLGQGADSLGQPLHHRQAVGGHHELTLSGRVPFYERRGDRNGYLGYRYRHWFSYELSAGSHVRAGLVGAQDAGEPFLANGNKWGYDAYNYYLQLSRLGWLDRLVVGKYKLSTGAGLVLNNSFSLGKMVTLQNMGRQTAMLRAHRSRSEAGGFQGIAATVSPARALSLTAFASLLPIDATLGDDGSARTIVTSGYHRTPAEMQKKHNTWQTDAGLSLSCRQGPLRLGLTTVYTHLSRRLSPLAQQAYRRYYPQGSDFINVGLDYGLTAHRFSFHGETAIDGNGHLATLNALSGQPLRQLRLVMLHRFYGYRYTALHARAFSAGTRVQNESGLFVGGVWTPGRALQLSAYADVARFPWARYGVSQSSWSHDYLAEALWQPRRHLALKGRYRLRFRQQDDSTLTALRTTAEHRLRLLVSYSAGQWGLKSQLDAVQVSDGSAQTGAMFSQHFNWKRKWLTVSGMLGFFRAPTYATRIYVSERQLPGDFSFPMYYGRGLHLSFLASADAGRRLRFAARLSHTRYSGRSTTGSGLAEILTPRQTALDLQLRLRL